MTPAYCPSCSDSWAERKNCFLQAICLCIHPTFCNSMLFSWWSTVSNLVLWSYLSQFFHFRCVFLFFFFSLITTYTCCFAILPAEFHPMPFCIFDFCLGITSRCEFVNPIVELLRVCVNVTKLILFVELMHPKVRYHTLVWTQNCPVHVNCST